MHDISAAQSIVNEVLKKIGNRKIRKVEIDVTLGMLRLHNPENVRFYISEIVKGKLGEGVKVKANIDITKPEITCRCGFSGAVSSVKTDEHLAHHGICEIKCPVCGSTDVKVEKGRECIIRKIKVQ